jgi:hypothetical protein
MTIQPTTDFTETAATELRRRIPDLTERIGRQEKRVQDLRATGAGPSGEMERLLAEMVGRRDAMQAQLVEFEAESRHAEPRRTNLRLVPKDKPALNIGWHIELFQGGVRLQKARGRP